MLYDTAYMVVPLWSYEPCQVDQSSTALDLFTALEFCDEGRAWDAEADLRRVICYTRGSKKLVIPPEWRPLVPTEI